MVATNDTKRAFIAHFPGEERGALAQLFIDAQRQNDGAWREPGSPVDRDVALLEMVRGTLRGWRNQARKMGDRDAARQWSRWLTILETYRAEALGFAGCCHIPVRQTQPFTPAIVAERWSAGLAEGEHLPRE